MRRRALAMAARATVGGVALTAPILLPPLAEDRVRGELAGLASVTSVEVSAMPAARLALGMADHVQVGIRKATSPTSRARSTSSRSSS